MSTSLPSIVPTGFTGTKTDFLNAPVDKSGALRLQTGSVSIPATTATDTVIGLVPFQKGARFKLDNSSIYSADLDSSTNVTLDVGFQYYDSADGTTDLDAWVSASTCPQAGGFATVDEIEGLTFIAAGPGWLVAQVNAATTTTGSITFAVGVAYDS